MKNKIFKIRNIATILSVFFMVSCDTLLDQNETDFGKGPILAQFESSSTTANFITDGTVATYNVPIAIVGGNNLPLSQPVDITISVDPSSTAQAGVEFALEKTTYTIMPGDMSVNAEIKVDTKNLDPFDAKTLVLRIDSSSQGVSESNKTNIVLQAVCELDMSSFVGDYTSTTTRVAGERTSKVELGPYPNSLLITNAEAYGTDEILAVLSGDVTKPTITFIEKEAILYVHATYGDLWATTISPGLSTYNSCDYSMNLEFKRCVSIGCFGGSRKITLVKQ
ncbi:hypothetical protein ES711_13225 [Gelidibacter salicanalis]|uniref:DUF1735 domain-containing protein n=1 Tax=Gelidibacter salicanalis TaxID=291193 RepID=A0A5C7AM75_9FLAO|nr:hypothetical protein [Gelidibacter salicanalis]TXE06902.1 hypothetical protein ES711_13225 [Gelidibacter salicanalis]